MPMTNQEQERLLTAVADAVLHCPQLRVAAVTCEHCGGEVTVHSTLGQRVNAAKQIRMAVARAIQKPETTQPTGV